MKARPFSKVGRAASALGRIEKSGQSTARLEIERGTTHHDRRMTAYRVAVGTDERLFRAKTAGASFDIRVFEFGATVAIEIRCQAPDDLDEAVAAIQASATSAKDKAR